MPLRRRPPPRPRAVVLIPAHDEETLLAATLDTVQPQLQEGDRVLVVAHNCSDGTAAVARERGTIVYEADDDGTGGKPDALKAGLRALDGDPPEVVVVIDADCSARPGAIDHLVRAVARSGGPAMSIYLFEAPEGGRAVQSISSLALLVKNHVRPLGLHALGLPCLLNGSGSAYPFELLRNAPHGEGSIAEDYQLSIDLLERGHPTRFVPEARVDSRLPDREKTALKQRRRWEHGHLYLVFRTAPPLILRGLARLDLARVAIGLEVAVPPLAFLVLAWCGSLVVSFVAALLGGWTGSGLVALWVSACAGTLLLFGLVSTFLRFLGTRGDAGRARGHPGLRTVEDPRSTWAFPLAARSAGRRRSASGVLLSFWSTALAAILHR